jgi:DNA-directed RNA polymerase subunit K/omega
MAPKKVDMTNTNTKSKVTQSEEKGNKEVINDKKEEVKSDSESNSDSDSESKDVKKNDPKKGGYKNQADDAYDFYKNYDPSKNQYDPILTPYERTSIIGVRATQLEDGAIPLVDIPEGMESVIEIAELELKMKKIPLIICREGREYWRVSDLANYNID